MWANYLTDIVKGEGGRHARRPPPEDEDILRRAFEGSGESYKAPLAQRFFAFEARATGNWAVVAGFELVEITGGDLASDTQIRIASNELNRTVRLSANIDWFRLPRRLLRRSRALVGSGRERWIR